MSASYALLDFGGGRRLERWGPRRLVRPDPRALDAPRLPDVDWSSADARYEGRVGRGAWQTREPLPDAWVVDHQALRFEIRLAPSMHTGLFPEQAGHWAWMAGQLAAADPADVLNLFAYTGGASMALAAAGHRVTHVDASRPAIGWAQRNATLNGLTGIRWIHDDARTFVAREIRRRRRYQGVVLDPPVFGRGAGGAWRLDAGLPSLLAGIATILAPDAGFVLLNTYGLEHAAFELVELLEEAMAPRRDLDGAVEGDTLSLVTPDGRELPTGVFARWRR